MVTMMTTSKSILNQSHHRVNPFFFIHRTLLVVLAVKRFRSEMDKTSNSNSVSSICQDVLPKLMNTVSVVEPSTSWWILRFISSSSKQSICFSSSSSRINFFSWKKRCDELVKSDEIMRVDWKQSWWNQDSWYLVFFASFVFFSSFIL